MWLAVVLSAACGGGSASVEAKGQVGANADGSGFGVQAEGSGEPSTGGQPGDSGWVGAERCGVPDGADGEQGESAVPLAESSEDDAPAIAGGPLATLPGFRVLPGGCSRVFLEMRGAVDVTEARAPGRLTYRLPGVRVLARTNRYDMPTDHFPTPVGRIHLVPVEGGAELIIELRTRVGAKAHLRRSPRGTVLNVDIRESDRPASEPAGGQQAAVEPAPSGESD